MLIFPAIDLYDKKAVRLYKGDYSQMTVYSENPPELAADFKAKGASCIHLVDLEGAKDGTTPNIDVVRDIVKTGGLFSEIGGGIRSLDTAEKYLSIGVDRVILGTAAVTDEDFLKAAVQNFKEHVAVGVDIKDGFVAIKGWMELSQYSCNDFCRKLKGLGVKTLIITDISRDGAMQGTNLNLYRDLSAEFDIDITASGGVSTMEDVYRLKEMGMYGAIIGKAYYTGAIDLTEAIEASK